MNLDFICSIVDAPFSFILVVLVTKTDSSATKNDFTNPKSTFIYLPSQDTHKVGYMSDFGK